MNQKVPLELLATGVPGLDTLLGGGLPRFSFNIIAGSPGAGKTTLAHQIMFGLANPERRALYFTVLGEPPLKMLRYQQRYSFFDIDKVNSCVRFVSLAEEVITGDFKTVMARILQEVKAHSPALVFVDSFRSVILRGQQYAESSASAQDLVQELAMHLTGWEATTFLIGEYGPSESESNPVFTVADGLIWLTQDVHRDSMVRKIEIKKMRGQAALPGLQTFRISDEGLRVFPRAIVDANLASKSPAADSLLVLERMNIGVPELDEMLGGGLPVGYSLLVAGPAGSGKSILAAAFLTEGVRQGECGVIAAFEKTPSHSLGLALQRLVQTGQIGVIDTRALDLTIDETLYGMTEMIQRLGARRVVIDSLSGYELALAPRFRENFRESLYRMVAVLTGMGMTVLMTCELEDRYTDLRFSPYGAAFLTDAIIVQRYVEIESCLKRVMAVVKVRASSHSDELRLFKITSDGIEIGKALSTYDGLLSGRPDPRGIAGQS